MVDNVIFDLDGTLTRVPSPWRYVHERLGVWDDVAAGFLDQWLSGEIPYDEFCRRDFQLWKDRDRSEIEELLEEIEINSHVPAIVTRLREESIQSIIISSGFSCVARRIQSTFGWEPLRIYANELVEGPEVRIHISADPNSPVSKKRLAQAALDEIGGDPERSLAVSDSERDLEMMAQCRYSLLVENEDDLAEVHRFLDLGR